MARKFLKKKFAFQFMIATLKNKFGLLKPFEFAILINAIGINFIKFIPYGILLLVSTWIYEVFIKKSLKFNFKILFSNYNFWFLTLPFWLAVFGLIYTSNFSKGFEDLGRIIPFLIFPILLFSIETEQKKSLNSFVLASFMFGLIIRFSIDFCDSFICFTYDYNIQNFFYTYLDSDTNILSIISMFAALFALEFLNVTKLNFNRKVIFQILILFLSLCILLLQSRIVILFYLVSLCFLLIYHWRKQGKWNIFSTLLFSAILMLLPPFQGRFQAAAVKSESLIKKDTFKLDSNSNVESLPCMSSTQLRFNSRKASLEIIKRNPILGVGTGDWQDELVKEYQNAEMPCNAHEKTAPHNQYLRTSLKFGFLGLAIYLFYLFRLFQIQRKERAFGQLAFLITIIFCGLGYDLLDVGSSAPFIAFFSTWLFFKRVK
ncbi:MAG: O-antigen ligase family protein [Bacteroidetes bacterium]|nr:O-antigen ligase family protein [Bacteroidota bacterium]